MKPEFPHQWHLLLDEHFSWFKSPITSESVSDTHREATESIRIVIKNNQISSVTKSKEYSWAWRSRGYLGLLQDTLNEYKIPDVDFIITLSDFPISYHRPPHSDIPVFSFCKSAAEHCILLPFTRFARDDVGLDYSNAYSWHWHNWHEWTRWDQCLERVNEINSNFPWEIKDPRCFFTGHATSWNDVRINFCKKSLSFPNQLLAYITYLQGDEHLAESELKSLIGKSMPMTQYPQFKYLIHLDGNSSSERLRYLLALNSVTIKHESPYYEFYYPLLRANQHYALVKEDLSDLIPTLEKLEQDEKLSRYIADEGMQFVRNILTYPNILLYMKEALERYAQLSR